MDVFVLKNQSEASHINTTMDFNTDALEGQAISKPSLAHIPQQLLGWLELKRWIGTLFVCPDRS